ncbi:hypothetical protein Tco_0992775 [Tanacetum coccineum]|uniref:Uncharacterized protein n=1 Tax=Tanacetum coccineum TaxID=301880 RepID=A0ABQ5F317_9ASTR
MFISLGSYGTILLGITNDALPVFLNGADISYPLGLMDHFHNLIRMVFRFNAYNISMESVGQYVDVPINVVSSSGNMLTHQQCKFLDTLVIATPFHIVSLTSYSTIRLMLFQSCSLDVLIPPLAALAVQDLQQVPAVPVMRSLMLPSCISESLSVSYALSKDATLNL